VTPRTTPAYEAKSLGHAAAVATQGFRPVYREDDDNACPGCGMSQWLVGRITAECAFCGTALPLDHTGMEGRSSATNFWKHDMMRHGHFDGYSHRSDWDQQATWEV
jgi:hypothetical protein